MKHIAIFRVIQWFIDVCRGKTNDLFFHHFFESFSAVVGTKEDMHSLNQIYFDIKFY